MTSHFRTGRGIALGIAAVGIPLLVHSSGTLAAEDAVPRNREAVVHALNRLAHGPRPGEVDRVHQLGLRAWIDQQLRPERIPDDPTNARLARLTTLTLSPQTIARDFIAPARQERRRRQAMTQGADTQPSVDTMAPKPAEPKGMTEARRRERQVFAELSEAKLLRTVYSERQLEEVLVDFWFNHFNVFARKGQAEMYLGAYERDVIRPHVMGTFRKMLGATARSPAMLVYLDNRSSRVNKLNENYARELLELHTLGVDGGYTQQDVIEVARAFTGWTTGPPSRPGFRFAPRAHDRKAKSVLAHTIASGGGIEDGERVLDILASHPATARHVAFKLAQRFVSDTPPASLVHRAAEAFRTTNGNLREVMRMIITSQEFFADESHHAKVKTPLEFVASVLRATNADVRETQPTVRVLTDLGMPLYLCQPPTGYAETADAWVSSGALVARLNFAVAVASGRMRGIDIPTTAEHGATSALSLGSAEFQRQ